MQKKRQLCLLTDGYLDVFTAKTALGLLRYCPDEVVAVVDSQHAGGNLGELVGVGDGVPIVSTVEQAAALGARQLVLGVTVPGGRLPADWRTKLLDAVIAGMDLINGLHTRLADDIEISGAAAAAGKQIWDVRTPPVVTKVGTGRARETAGKRILSVGMDANLGKRVTALELTKALRAAGKQVEMIATGQTGVMITGKGVVVDAVVSDFVSGAIEAAILERPASDFVVVEGQGALLHPGYSAVSLGLLHGTVPDYMVLCHAPARKLMRNSDVPLVQLGEMISICESLVRPIHPAKVIAVSLNCHGLTDDQAAEARDRAHKETGLPVVDPVKTGVDELVQALCD